MGEETTRLREEIDRTRDDLTRNVDLLTDKTSPSRIVERRMERARSRVRHGMTGLKEKVMGSAPGTGRPAQEGRLQSARETAAGAAEQARERATSGVREQTEGNPFAAGLVAFGAGWLVSSLLPVTKAEEYAAQRAGEAAREHGGPVIEQAKQAAQEVGQNLQAEAGEHAQHVKERAQEAAGSIKEEARGAARSG